MKSFQTVKVLKDIKKENGFCVARQGDIIKAANDYVKVWLEKKLVEPYKEDRKEVDFAKIVAPKMPPAEENK